MVELAINITNYVIQGLVYKEFFALFILFIVTISITYLMSFLTKYIGFDNLNYLRAYLSIPIMIFLLEI